MRAACGAKAVNARTQAAKQAEYTVVRPLAARRCSAARGGNSTLQHIPGAPAPGDWGKATAHYDDGILYS